MRLPYKIAILSAAMILGTAMIIMAQDSDTVTPPSNSQQQTWLPEQLNNLVAPIALYPDPLLGQVLVASTYPLEVVEASQWMQRNSGLRGQALIDAARQQPWDPSIQALVAVPDALEKLNQDIRWTTDLGNAFLAQQDDVMNAVQTMRLRAQADGRLSSTDKQIVQTENQGSRQVIEILPASPNIIYVPVYDPFYIWGPPVYGYYPALYYPSFGFGFGPGFNLAFYFGGWGGWNSWGWGPYWFGNTVVVNNSFFYRYGFHDRFPAGNQRRTAWRHDPDHRMNVPYASPRVAERFGGSATGVRSPRWAIPNQTGNQISRGTSASGFRSQSQSRTQTPRQNRYSSDRYRNAPRAVPSGQQAERNYRASQQNRQSRSSSMQTYRAPQPQRLQAPQMYRSNPGMSGARPGGNSGFSIGRSYSQGGSGGNNRNNGGGRRR